MDRQAVLQRLKDAGLSAERAEALTDVLWTVHSTGELDEVGFARLSDAGFRHLDVCIMRELLAAALSRRTTSPGSQSPVEALLEPLSGDEGP